MAYGNSSNNSGSTATGTTAKPTGMVAGDILLDFITYDSSSLTVGWNESQNLFRTDQVTLDGQTLSTAWKLAGGSEPSNYTATINSAVTWAQGALNLTGRDTASSPVASSASISSAANTDPVTVTANGVTAVAGDDLVWVACMDCTASAGTGTFTPPSGYTTRIDVSNTFCRLVVAVKENVSAGATGTVSGTMQITSGTSGWAAQLIRVPAAAGGTDLLLGQVIM